MYGAQVIWEDQGRSSMKKKNTRQKKPRGYPWAISHYQKENQCTCSWTQQIHGST